MYENANTPASANAMPASPTTSVIATPAIVSVMLSAALGSESTRTSSGIRLRLGFVEPGRNANIAKLMKYPMIVASATAI